MSVIHRLAGLVFLVALEACATGASSRENTPRPNEPSAETQQVTFQLIKSTLECFGGKRPAPGKIVLVGVFSAPSDPIEVFDSASTPGNEEAIARAIREGARQRSPKAPPSPFVRYFIVFPGGPESIRIDFPKTSPPRRSSISLTNR
jgi:hypothetical protein